MNCWKVHICLLLTVMVSECQAFKMYRRVVNGQAMARGEWPFLVSLQYLKPFAFTTHSKMLHVCGGALIRERWVLTAAHCVGFYKKMSKVEDWNVVLGEHNQYRKEVGEQILKPEAFFIHPGFQPSKTGTILNDIALIKLSDDAELSSLVGLMDVSNETVREEDKCQIGGWGQVSAEPYGWGMYIPLKATVYAIGNTTCANAYSDILYDEGDIRIVVNDNVLCAGIPRDKQSKIQSKHGGVNDGCNGDSGSPLMCAVGPEGEYVIAGVVSAGYGCGEARYPGVYTKVSKYTTWLLDTIANN